MARTCLTGILKRRMAVLWLTAIFSSSTNDTNCLGSSTPSCQNYRSSMPHWGWQRYNIARGLGNGCRLVITRHNSAEGQTCHAGHCKDAVRGWLSEKDVESSIGAQQGDAAVRERNIRGIVF